MIKHGIPRGLNPEARFLRGKARERDTRNLGVDGMGRAMVFLHMRIKNRYMHTIAVVIPLLLSQKL